MIRFRVLFGSMRLTETQKKVLAIIELDADRAASQVARNLRMKVATVEHAIARLREIGLLVGRTALIDVYALGLSEFGIFCTVSAPSENAQTRFIAALKKDMSVTWLAETGGRYEFMINILASDAAVVRQKLVEWSERYGVTLVTKNLCIRTERMRFCRGYFGPPRSTAPLFHTRAGRGQQQLDTVDVAILTALAAASFESFRELALTCGVPIATFLRRVQRLKERRILLGFGYKLNLSVLHVEQFRLLIRMRQLTSSGHTSLIEFCGQHPNIKLLVVTVGSWDYEIEVDLYPNQSARVLARHIQTALRGAIDSIEICPIFQHLKYISFPPGLVKQ